MERKKIVIAAPVFNEEKILLEFLQELETLFVRQEEGQREIDFTRYAIKLLIVNDGSKDNSLEILREYKGALDLEVINFSRNFGHTAACMACIDYADCDALVLMDSDLQDDPKAIIRFIRAWEDGNDVVYAVRSSRRENFFLKTAFYSYYRLLNLITNIDIPLDAGNFSLISRPVIEQIKSIPLRNRYLPGLRAYVGFKQTGIPVPRRERPDKKSHVGFKGLFRLAFNGIFSFSYLPIRLFNLLGCLSLLISFLLTLYALWHKLFSSETTIAWASQIISISFFGGINILGLGIIGEYIARIYDQIKGYPPYVVRDTIRPRSKEERDG